MVLYLKIYRHTKGHLDFLLHHRLEILYFCSFKFRPVIQRELTFVKGVRSASRFWFFFARGCPLAPAPFVEKILSFPSFSPLSGIIGQFYGSLFLGSLCCPIDLFVYSFANISLS